MRLEGALHLSEVLLSLGIVVNVITCNAAFITCGLESAPRLLEEIQSQGIAANVSRSNAR